MVVQIDRIKIQSLPFRKKTLAKMWLHQLRRDVRFMAKHLRMSTFVMNTSQRIVTKSVTDTKCWVRRSGKRLRQDAVPKILECITRSINICRQMIRFN